MRVQNPKKFRRLVHGRCRYCDRRFFFRQTGRPRLHCDHKCQQAEFRHSRYLHPKRDESGKKSSVKSKISKVDFADRPLNVLGGYRFGGQADRDLWAKILAPDPESPTGPSRWTPAWDANWPSDDLPIPALLQRRLS